MPSCDRIRYSAPEIEPLESWIENALIAEVEFAALRPDLYVPRTLQDAYESYNKYALGKCHDCGCSDGEFHISGCDAERCRLCGGQIIACECPDTKWL